MAERRTGDRRDTEAKKELSVMLSILYILRERVCTCVWWVSPAEAALDLPRNYSWPDEGQKERRWGEANEMTVLGKRGDELWWTGTDEQNLNFTASKRRRDETGEKGGEVYRVANEIDGWIIKKRGKGGETEAVDGGVRKHSGEMRGENEDEKKGATTAGRRRRKAKSGVKKTKRHFRMVTCHETMMENVKLTTWNVSFSIKIDLCSCLMIISWHEQWLSLKSHCLSNTDQGAEMREVRNQ